MDQDEPIIDQTLERLHQAASECSVAVNAAVAETLSGKHPYPLAGGALYRLGADTLAFHQADLALCVTEWVSCSAPLLRTLLDLLLSTLIIVERREEAEMRGFRCTHYFLKATVSRNPDDAALRTFARQQVDSGIARLPPAEQQRARDFVFLNQREQ